MARFRGDGATAGAFGLLLLLLLVLTAAAAADDRQQQQRLPPSDVPLEVFYLGGQSECVGKASVDDLRSIEGAERYPELQGTIDGVWMAGYTGFKASSPDAFFVDEMSASVDDVPTFGPEVAFGERIRTAIRAGKEKLESNVLIVKYCAGGTNVRRNWNPSTPENGWDRSRDDGTSKWLLENASVVLFFFNDMLFNEIYTIRRTREVLDDAGISYRWSGIVWVQGLADQDPDDDDNWKTFGEDTARVWNELRRELGGSSRTKKGGGPAVPIIDTGSSWQNQLKSGKEYAVGIVDGCRAATIEYGLAAYDEGSSTCVVRPSEPCLDDLMLDTRIFDRFGWDPRTPPDLLPTSKSIETFRWWVSFPTNQHSAYDGMVLQSRMLADEFLRVFVPPSFYDLSRFDGDDAAALFPYEPCPTGVGPSRDRICWIDHRQKQKERGNLCEPLNGSGSGKSKTTAAVEDEEEYEEELEEEEELGVDRAEDDDGGGVFSFLLLRVHPLAWLLVGASAVLAVQRFQRLRSAAIGGGTGGTGGARSSRDGFRPCDVELAKDNRNHDA